VKASFGSMVRFSGLFCVINYQRRTCSGSTTKDYVTDFFSIFLQVPVRKARSILLCDSRGFGHVERC
jgi:hypothetical protein